MRRDLPGWALAALAVTLPAALWLVHRDLGHHGDMAFFQDWLAAFSEGRFYVDGPGVNYPILGVWLTCAPAWVVEQLLVLDPDGHRWLHKATLAGAEALYVLALAGLGRALGIGRPRLTAVALYLLPATWAGGAWFGQIDVWGSLFLVLSATGFLRAWRAEAPALPFAAGLLAGAAAVLTKQLTAFTLPALILLAVGALLAHRRSAEGRTRWVLAALLVASPLLLVAADPFLALPEGYTSHLHFIWVGGGSAHGEVLSGNGANLWALVDAPPETSARTWTWLGVSAWGWGVGSFAAVQLGLWLWLARGARSPDLPARLVLYGGISNLAMAVLLTGVHERYLVHGVPFLLLGLAALRPRGWRRLVEGYAWLGCGWSGLFVLSSLHWEAFGGVLAPFRSHTLTAWIELALLAAVLLGLSGRSAPATAPRPLRAVPAPRGPAGGAER